MARDERIFCQYCWNPHGNHNEGCPISVGTLEAMVKWEAGRNQGFHDGVINDYIPWYWWDRYDKSFIYGYRVGQTEIEGQIAIAAESRS